MVSSQTIQAVTKYCTDNLNLKAGELGNEYYYASMPLCVVDSIFSINARYESVTKIVRKVCDYYQIARYRKIKHAVPPIDEQVSTSKFLDLLNEKTPQELANDVFDNRRPTSSKSGILKADAVVKFLKVLKEFDAEHFQDIPKLVNSTQFELSITNIPGQRSGITLKYFFMLAGSDDIIKPDRMVLRFLQAATGQKFTLEQCQSILCNVTGELNAQGHNLTPRLLDHVIWNFQRTVTQKNTSANSSFASAGGDE